MFSFLKHYGRMRLDVILGRRRAAGPLGIGYCWKLWEYEQHLKRLKARSWQH